MKTLKAISQDRSLINAETFFINIHHKKLTVKWRMPSFYEKCFFINCSIDFNLNNLVVSIN